MKKLIIISIISLVPVFAQATESAKFNQQVQQNIKNRIDKVVEEKATASGEVLASKTLVRRGWVGTIADIAQKTLTITTKSDSRQASFSDTTVFVESPRKKILKSTDLAIGAHVIAIGFVNGNGVMDLRRLIVVTNFKAPPQREVKLITIGDTDLKLSSKTRITSGSDQKKTDSKALTEGAKALLITSDGTPVRIHLL